MAKIQINEDDIKHIVKKCLNEIFLKEGQRMTEYFIVEKMLDKPINIDMNQITKHFNDRGNRMRKIEEKIKNIGTPIYSFIVNCGHMNGREIHTITEKGLIIVQNARTKNIITILIARPGQVTRYWEGLNLETPQNDEEFEMLMRFCKLHKNLGHNNF